MKMNTASDFAMLSLPCGRTGRCGDEAVPAALDDRKQQDGLASRRLGQPVRGQWSRYTLPYGGRWVSSPMPGDVAPTGLPGWPPPRQVGGERNWDSRWPPTVPVREQVNDQGRSARSWWYGDKAGRGQPPPMGARVVTGPTGCGEIRRALGVYLVGAVDPADRAFVESHLASCQGCREELAGLAGLPGRLGSVPATDVIKLTLGDPAPDDQDEGYPPEPTLRSLLEGAAALRRHLLWRRVAAC